MNIIEPDRDFTAHYRAGSDPDRDCQRLYQWHRALWGRTVPGIRPFKVEVAYDRRFELRLETADGSQFRLASDAMIPTWSAPGWTKRFDPELATEIGKDAGDFYRLASTVGAYIVFPLNRPGQTGWTINQARGMRIAVADRFDLTLECIRRHYCDRDAENPLGSYLSEYADFFSLFGDFDSYVRFFLLDDFVTPDRVAVRSLMSGPVLGDLSTPALPAGAEEYAEYARRSIASITDRNNRIHQLSLSVADTTGGQRWRADICAAAEE